MMLLQPRSMCDIFRSHPAQSKARNVVAAAKKQKPQKKKLRKPKQSVPQRIYVDDNYYLDDDDEYEDSGVVQSVLVPGARVPAAPAPVDAPRAKTPKPEDLYPVFPKPQQPMVAPISSSSSDGKWSWGTDAPGSQRAQQQDTPMWNPKTGFMKTREQIEQEAAAAAAAPPPPVTGQAAASSGSSSTSAGPDTSSSSSRLVEPLPTAAASGAPPAWQQQQQLPPLTPPAAATTAGDLPAIGKEQILGSCISTSASMLVGAAMLHIFAQRYSAGLFGTDQALIDQLVRLPPGLESLQTAGYMFGAAGVVTAARLLLLQLSSDFSDATNRSNKQVLSPLDWADVALVALLTGVSEELLFRGGLVPLTWPDYRGVLLSGLVFGVLHVGGGRNAVFAAWATVVGWLYGAAFLASGNVWVAAGAHSLANFASAAVWLSSNKSEQLNKH